MNASRIYGPWSKSQGPNKSNSFFELLKFCCEAATVFFLIMRIQTVDIMVKYWWRMLFTPDGFKPLQKKNN